jgi:hypothetical protein
MMGDEHPATFSTFDQSKGQLQSSCPFLYACLLRDQKGGALRGRKGFLLAVFKLGDDALVIIECCVIARQKLLFPIPGHADQMVAFHLQGR